MQDTSDWKTKFLIIGALVGLVSGLIAAFVIIQRAEQKHVQPNINAGDGVKVGLGVLGVLKLISDIGDKS
jgi:uncharacterized protein YpmS